jgi:hypothetical protein
LIQAAQGFSSSNPAQVFSAKNNSTADFEFSGWFTWNLEAARPKGSTAIWMAPEQEAFSGAV